MHLSLIPRPSTPPVFDHLKYPFLLTASDQKQDRGVEGLGTRLHVPCVSKFKVIFLYLARVWPSI